jgi:hypothetical protein
LVISLIGIGCSTWFCLSPKYFSFVAVRNDTFWDEDKVQPDPFRFATAANVGVFRYEILEVYEYPWPPPKQERTLYEDAFEDALLEEIRKLQAGGNNGTSPDGDVLNDANSTNVPGADNSTAVPLANQTAAPTAAATDAPSVAATTVAPEPNATETPIIPIGPGSEALSFEPTSSPTTAPTITNPNDIVALETYPINTVTKYEFGSKQFEGDSVMNNGQMGALYAPIFAGVGVFFCCIELFCCVYKCSWLPTALFLYAAFMLQTFTVFVFLSEDFWYVCCFDCPLKILVFDYEPSLSIVSPL